MNLQTDSANCGACGNRCCTGYLCGGGECVGDCQTGLAYCSADRDAGSSGSCLGDPFICTDLAADPNNCGACAHQCPTGTSCHGGGCV